MPKVIIWLIGMIRIILSQMFRFPMIMGKYIIIIPPPTMTNGHPYVNLGLPSGTLWATCNVGASKPSDYGQYFQWGDTSGYTAEQIGNGEGQKKFALDGSDYKWRVGSNFSKYTKEGEALELEDDAAHANMGGSWHMPTPTQIQELTANTTSAWTTNDGVNGITFTSKKDSSKFIFIPAAWNAWNGKIAKPRDYGSIWLCMLNTHDVNSAYHFDFYPESVILRDASYRYNGRSMRGVIG